MKAVLNGFLLIFRPTNAAFSYNIKFFPKFFSKCFTSNLCYYFPMHCVKSVQIWIFFWSVFSVSLRIQSECGKIRTRKNSVFGHFPRSDDSSTTNQILHVSNLIFFFSKKTTLLIKFASSFNRNRVKKAINV